MTARTPLFVPNPKFDLVLERVVDVPRELVWQAWTRPEYLKRWFTPAPWTTVEAELDLRPGGLFRTVMRSPEGQEFPNIGCYLEVVENERLTWTNVLGAGFRPRDGQREGAACDVELSFTAVISLQPHGTGTKYSALAIHGTEAGRERHEQMGFQEGWNAALDQLVALMRK